MQIIGYILAVLSIILLAVDRILKRKSLFSLGGSFFGLLSGILLVMTTDATSFLLLTSQITVFVLLFLIMTKPDLKLPYLLKYLPAVMFLVTVPVFGIRNGFPPVVAIPGTVVITVAYALIGHGWIETPQKQKKEGVRSGSGRDGYKSCEFEKELLPHALLLFFTFGIYQFIWIYKMTRYTNTCQKEPGRNPVTELLLCIIIPFYSVYWFYVTAKRVDKLSGQRSHDSNLATFCLVTAIIMSVVPAVLLQDRVNHISKSRK